MASTQKIIEYSINKPVLTELGETIYRHIDSYAANTDEAEIEDKLKIDILTEQLLKELYELIDAQNIDDIITATNLEKRDVALDHKNRREIVKVLKQDIKAELLPKMALKDLLPLIKIMNRVPPSSKESSIEDHVLKLCEALFIIITSAVDNRSGCCYKEVLESTYDHKTSEVEIYRSSKPERYTSFILVVILILIGIILYSYIYRHSKKQSTQ